MEHRRARRDGVLGWSVTLYAHLPALDSFGGRSAAENDTRWRERERPRAESYGRSRRSRSTMPRGPERPSGSANWHRSSKANSCPAMAAHAEGLLHGDGAALDAAAATFTERGGELSWRPRVDRELRREPDAGAGIG